MTLDEARAILHVERGTTHAAIREAFRLRARELHPDLHPDADEAEKRRLARQFDQTRKARDILLLLDPITTPPPGPDGSGSPPADTTHRRPAAAAPGPAPFSTTPPTTRREARPAASASTHPQQSSTATKPPPPRHTLRFEEFVRQADAAGFGPGIRTRRYVDVPRIAAWSVVAVAVCAVGTGALFVVNVT